MIPRHAYQTNDGPAISAKREQEAKLSNKN